MSRVCNTPKLFEQLVALLNSSLRKTRQRDGAIQAVIPVKTEIQSSVMPVETGIDRTIGIHDDSDFHQNDIVNLRSHAIEQLLKEGLPSKNHEHWRHFNLSVLERFQFVGMEIQSLRDEVEAIQNKDELPPSQKLPRRGPGLPRSLQSLAMTLDASNSVELLAYAFAPKIIEIDLDEKNPTLRLNKQLAIEAHQAQASVLHVRVKKGVKAQLIEEYKIFGNAAKASIEWIKIILESQAQLEHVQFFSSFDNGVLVKETFVKQAENSKYQSYVLQRSWKHSHNAVRVHLKGQNASCVIKSLISAQHEEHLHLRTDVRHQHIQTQSEQLVKGLYKDKSYGAFSGHIEVAEGAELTNAKQYNHNLTLNEKAQVFTQPHLQIHNDNVHCSHGATIGQLSQEALFYLKARGISLDVAQNMLIHAFANEVIETVPFLCETVDWKDFY